VTVLLFATLDTKGDEAAWLRELLRASGVAVTLVDTGCLGLPAVQADISRDEVFHLAGTSLSALTKQDVLLKEGPRYVVVDSLLREWVARRTF